MVLEISFLFSNNHKLLCYAMAILVISLTRNGRAFMVYGV